MGVEIERKFLVRRDLWSPGDRCTLLRQGYLSLEPARTVRVRRAGDRAFVTIKGQAVGLERPEFEYEIPVADADALLRMCIQPLIEKRRYLHENDDGHLWEVDDFLGDNAGLLVAELELESESESFASPVWLDVEVTDDPRYLNSSLAVRPFSRWQ